MYGIYGLAEAVDLLMEAATSEQMERYCDLLPGAGHEIVAV
jgi:hypothetical protein